MGDQVYKILVQYKLWRVQLYFILNQESCHNQVHMIEMKAQTKTCSKYASALTLKFVSGYKQGQTDGELGPAAPSTSRRNCEGVFNLPISLYPKSIFQNLSHLSYLVHG